MRKSRIVSAVATAAALLVTTATPASATSVLEPSLCGAWYTQTCSGFAQEVPGVSGTDVLVGCTAAGTYPSQVTAVHCYIEGVEEQDVHVVYAQWTQGVASTTARTFPAEELRSSTYRVCVGAGFVDMWGVYHHVGGYACAPVL